MKYKFKRLFSGTLILILFGSNLSVVAAAKKTSPSAKQCGVLVYNAHSLFNNPQDKMGTMVNSGKLFEKWRISSGIPNNDAVREVKKLIHNSFNEFDSKEKFEAYYSKEQQKFCADILKEELENNQSKTK